MWRSEPGWSAGVFRRPVPRLARPAPGAHRIVEGGRRCGRPLPRDRSTPMTGGNLTRDEAEERARLGTAGHYAVELDLTRGESTFGSRSTITFACSEPGAATFVDLLAPAVRAVTLNGEALDPAEVFDGARVDLRDPLGE